LKLNELFESLRIAELYEYYVVFLVAKQGYMNMGAVGKRGPRGSGGNSELCRRLQGVKFPALSLHRTQGQGRGTRKNKFRKGRASPL
jgi:hypothetical protein